MASTLRPIGHDERLTLVEHLDELRTRLMICAVVLVVAFSVCFWQNDTILSLINRPLEQTQNLEGKERSNDPLEQSARFQQALGRALKTTAPALRELQASVDQVARRAALPPAEQAQLRQRSAQLDAALRDVEAAARALPTNRKRQPVTLGPAEPFTTTVSVALYSAILLALPLLLYQVFAFLLPAFSPREKRVALPLMAMIPLLFVGGVAFAYLVVLPRAIDFLQNFNDDNFDILLQARDYYRFSIIFIGGIGLMFLMPIVVLAVTRTGIVSPRQLRANRGYVVLAIAVVAAVATPTPDPVTMTIAMGPLIVLFELSILLAAWMDRRGRRREAEEADRDDADRDDEVASVWDDDAV